MDGLILVLKPPRMTSHDVVASLRRILSQKKIGHFGTLDPLASGLLLAAVGKATRFFPFFSKMDKSYEGRMRIGFATDTYDAEGQPTSPEINHYPDERSLAETIGQLEGNITQFPPPYSAKKLRGKPLYIYARRKTPVESRPFQVRVFAFKLKSYLPPYFDFEIRCSSGTYIRALADDLGRKLGCGAHLSELIRTEVGEYHHKDGRALEEIRDLHEKGMTDEFLIPMELLLPFFPKISLTGTGLQMVRNGRPLSGEHIVEGSLSAGHDSERDAGAVFRLFGPDGKMVALARPAPPPAHLSPFLVLL
jgi:tRNA pseudouridine55 synthase